MLHTHELQTDNSCDSENKAQAQGMTKAIVQGSRMKKEHELNTGPLDGTGVPNLYTMVRLTKKGALKWG